MRRARPRSATYTSSTRTGSESTASGRRRIHSTFTAPPTRSSLGAIAPPREVSEATATAIVNVLSGTTLALSEVLGIASRMRYVDEYPLYLEEWDGEFYTSSGRRSGRGRHSELHMGIAVCRACAPILPAHHSIYHLQIECRHPFRERSQFIVIAVMSVMRGTFP